MLSAIHLYFISKEGKKYINAKVDKIYELIDDSINIRLHHSVFSEINIIVNENFFYFTDNRIKNKEKPSSFIMLLRKYLNNTRMKNIECLNGERLILIEFEKEEKYKLFIEYIRPFNFILCRSDNKIIYAKRFLEFSTRKIKINENYYFPFRDFNMLEINFSEFKQIILSSNKENIVKCLAVDLGLSGLFAEEIIARANIDKNKKIDEINEEEIRILFDVYKKMLNLEPKGFIYNLNNKIIISPFELISFNRFKIKEFDTFSDSMEYLHLNKIKMLEESKEEIKIKNIIKQQEENLSALNNEYSECKKKGEIIYENYILINEIIKFIKDNLKLNESELEKEVKKRFNLNIKINKKEKYFELML